MLKLTILMFERSGLIIMLAFVLMVIPYFKKCMNSRRTIKSVIVLIFVFSFFGIISNFTGVEINNNNTLVLDRSMRVLSDQSSLANTRALTIGVAGLIGGPLVGSCVGIISGVTRYFQGGENAITYVFSSLLIGGIAGSYGWKTLKVDQFPSVS